MQMDVRELGLFEKEYDLFDRTYNGIPYWQMIRLTVFESIFTEHISRKDLIKNSTGILSLIRYFFKGIIYSLSSKILMSGLGRYDIICFKADKNKDKFYDAWEIPEQIPNVFIRGNNNIDEFSFDQKYNILGPYLKANLMFAAKKMCRALSKDNQEFCFLQMIECELTKRYGCCISAIYMEKQIQRYIEYNKYYTKFFRKLFSKINCRAIMVVWYYQMPMMIAYRVAKELGIRVIELQHGVINNHEQYWFEDDRGINNYTPDYFLAFGQTHIAWTKMLPSTYCVPVGYPFQEKEINNLKDMATEEKTIIVYPEDQEPFERVIDDFVNCAHDEGFRILLKLHPLQAEKYEVYYPILSKNKNLEVIQDQSKGIYYWLKLGRFHVMANTTVGFEALAFSHTNICIAENINHEQVQPLLDWNLARGFHNSWELMELVRNPSDRQAAQNWGIWEPNGEKNISEFLINLRNQGYPDGVHYKELTQ